ncbi:tetratricopeptide repeat-containing protein [Toxoplasma gondii CAST]|uniref:Tetratricopeptide repeat-containing protein n=1 Tax=Toxoplasma gondii CAST TaxID=943122 RepID=A0A3R7YNT3_TOXGO|nr:tetratricopeptide repeat-containing protein [Toxoplasma gondii CAST]
MAGRRLSSSRGLPLLSRLPHTKASFLHLPSSSSRLSSSFPPSRLSSSRLSSSRLSASALPASSSASHLASSAAACSWPGPGVSPRLPRQPPARLFPLFSFPASPHASPGFAAVCSPLSLPSCSFASESGQVGDGELLRRVEAAAARLTQEAEKRRLRQAEPHELDNHAAFSPPPSNRSPFSSLSPQSPSSPPSHSSSLPLANAVGRDELLEKGGETLPAGPESTFVDVGYRVEKVSHWASAMNQLQSTLLLLHACPAEGGLKAELRRVAAKAYLDMAMLSHQCNKLDAAADAYQRALGFYLEQVLQDDLLCKEIETNTQREEAALSRSAALDIANCLSCVGVVEADRQNTAKAVEYLEQAMLWKASLVHSLPLAPLLKDLERQTGRTSSSLSLTKEARDERRQAMEIPLEPEGLFFDTMNSLGGIYLRQGKVRESTAVLRFAVKCMYSLGELYTCQRFRPLGRNHKRAEVQTVAETADDASEEPLTLGKLFRGDRKEEMSPKAPSSPSSLSSPSSSSLPSSLPSADASPGREQDAFAFFLTALCQHINEERRVLREEARRAAEQAEERKRELRRMQVKQMEARAGIPAERSEPSQDAPATAEGERREEGRSERKEGDTKEPCVAGTPAKTKMRSGAESLLPYGTIVFYNLSQSLLALGKHAEARDAVEKAEALAQLARKPDLESRVAALKVALSAPSV